MPEDDENNCHFADDTKQSILNTLSDLRSSLADRGSGFDDLLSQIDDVVDQLKAGSFGPD